MEQKLRNPSFLIPAGLAIVSFSIYLLTKTGVEDLYKGISMGIGIGLLLLPFVFKRISKADNR